MAKKSVRRAPRKVLDWSHADGLDLKRFRVGKRWEPKDMAEEVGVHVNAVYAWERGEYGPSAETFARLAQHSDWEHTKWFLEKAGWSKKTIEQISDSVRRDMAAADVNDVNVLIQELNGSGVLPFPSSLISNPASTRFSRLQGEEYPFKDGDIVLIDPTETDLRKIEDGCLVAFGYEPGSAAGLVGTIARVPPYAGRDEWFLLQRPGSKDIIIGVAPANAPLKIASYIVLGRVVAWIHQGAHKHIPDNHCIARAPKPPRGPDEDS